MQTSTNTEREAACVAMREGQQSWLARPGTLLRIEGGVLLMMSVLLYWMNGGSWVLSGLLILAPDVSMLGYLLGSNAGTASYNSAHNYALPAGLVVFGVMGDSPWR